MTNSAPDLVAVLGEAAALALRRVRHRSLAWWRTPAEGGGGTRADVVARLVAAFARLEQEVGPDPAPPGYDVPPRPPRDDVLADQLAVVADDLLRALGDRPDPGVTRRALAECVVATYDADPRPVPDAFLDVALAGAAGPLRGRLERLPRLRDA